VDIRPVVLRLLYYEGVLLRKKLLKLTPATHLLFISPLLASFYFATPPMAAAQRLPPIAPEQTAPEQTAPEQIAQEQIAQVQTDQLSPTPSVPRPSFYEQQRDKLRYEPNSTPLSTDFSFLRKDKSEQAPSSKQVPPTDNDRFIVEEQNTHRNRADENRDSLESHNNSRDIELGKPELKTVDLDNDLEKKQPFKDRVQQQIRAQKRNSTKIRSAFSSEHKDPHVILKAAKKKHSPLQGRNLTIESFNADKVNIRAPEIAPLAQQISEKIDQLKIDQLKADLRTNLQQQPEQLRQVMAAAKTDIQQRSADKISGPLNNLKALIQRNIKDPLSRLLRKVSAAAQETAEQLQ